MDMLEGSLGKKRLCEITPQVIEDFRKQRQDEPTQNGKKRSDTTINRELEILRRLLNKAVLNEQLEKNPFDRFRDHGEEIFFEEAGRLRFLEKDEINSLLEEAPVYLQRIIKGAILTGLRKGDLLKIKWTDINLEKGTLTYFEQKERGKKPIIKYLNQDMIDLLMKTPAKGECVFLGPDGKPLKNVTRFFKTALRKAGIENFRFHDLRHTSASLLVMEGASMKYVQEHLGHSDIKTTQRCTQLSEEFQKQEIQKLNGLFVTGEKTVRNSESQKELETQPFVTV